MSKWKRLGKILDPRQTPHGFPRYTQIPTPVLLDNELIRIFYSTRDASNRASTFFIDVDPQDNMRVVFQSFVPAIFSSPAGSMDKDGVALTSVLKDSEESLAYFTGLELGTGPYFKTHIGVAPLRGNERVEIFSKKWCLPVNDSDPYMLMTPFVMRISDCYHLWYASTIYWIEDAQPSIEYCYVIKHATSTDGVQWKRSEKVAIEFNDASEGGVTRPSVVFNRSQYEMWYCSRGHYSVTNPTLRYYQIGYATSPDLVNWTRKDELFQWVNPPLPGEWDYEMQCYPYVVNYRDRQLMFYCGNQYSQAGLGVAERVF